MGSVTFSNLFKDDSQDTIVEVVRLSNSFPDFVNHEDNVGFMKEVRREELQQTIQSFQMDESIGLDGLYMK